MNNSLIIERYKNNIYLNEITYNYNTLTEFIEKYGNIFVEAESKDALCRMMSECEKLKNERKALEEKLLKINEEIRKTCLHEIIYDDGYQYVCPLCGEWFSKQEKIDFEHILLNDVDNTAYREIMKIIHSIASNNEHILDTFEEYAADNKHLEELKMYRRRKNEKS